MSLKYQCPELMKKRVVFYLSSLLVAVIPYLVHMGREFLTELEAQ